MLHFIRCQLLVECTGSTGPHISKAKMSLLVKLLSPVIRICQWSGLSPLDLNRDTAFTSRHVQSHRILMVIWLTIEIAHFLHGFIQMDIYINWKFSKILIYIDIITPLFIRLHVIVLFIESFLKRSEQVELLDKIAEIETFFVRKFQVKIDAKKLQRKFRNYLIFWVLRIAGIIVCMCLVKSWGDAYYLLLYIVPFYSSTLMYAQYLSYVETIRYCVELLNENIGQFDMSHVSQQEQSGEKLVEKRTFIFTFNKIERLRDLRHVYRLIWQASLLVNHYVLWSLPIAINNEFITLINDLYWIFLLLLDPINLYPQALICSIWAFINLSYIYQTANTCDRTIAAVSFDLNSDIKNIPLK